MNLGNLKLGTKLIIAFSFVCAIGAVVSAIGIKDMEQIRENADRSYPFDLVGLSLTQQANTDVTDVGIFLRTAILASTAEQRAAALTDAEKAMASARAHLDQAKPLVYTEKGKTIVADLDRSWVDYTAAFAAPPVFLDTDLG